MKILHIIPKFPINLNGTVIGGSANSLLNLVRQQKITGDDVKILSYFPLISKSKKDFLKENAFKNIDIHAEPNSKAYGAEFTLKATLRAMFDKLDAEIVHGHSGYIDYLLASILISKISNSHLVYSLYCPVNLQSIVTKYPLRNKYLEYITNNVTFIAISKNIASSLSQLSINRAVHIIPPAINIEKFSDSFNKAELRKRHSFDISQPIILFVGNYSQTKNMECVLLAFSKFLTQFPNARLIITTELKMEKFSDREIYLQKLIDDLNINQKIIFKGIIDNMPELMQLSDVLVAPFRDTDGPSDYYLAALESMSVGTPAFVSPVGGMKEVVNTSNGRLIQPDQPDQLTNELVNYFSDRSLGYEMGVNAARFIRQNFAPELVEKKVKEVYMDVSKNEN